MAPSRVVHANCGIFSFISGPVDQVVCNAVTGETFTVQRSAQMIAAQKIYVVKYNEEGWAYLLGHESGKKWFKPLGFTLQAKTDDKGKIFIQDSVAKRVYHCDDATELGKRGGEASEHDSGGEVDFHHIPQGSAHNSNRRWWVSSAQWCFVLANSDPQEAYRLEASIRQGVHQQVGEVQLSQGSRILGQDQEEGGI